MNQKTRLKSIIFAVILSQLLTACSSGNIKKSGSDKAGQQETEEILKSTGLKVTSAEDATLKAQKAIQSGNMDLAQLYYIKAYELDPSNVQVLEKMADLYIKIKKYDLAELSLKLILKQQPNDLKTIERYGLLLIKMRNFPAAEENLNRVVAKQQSWRAYNGLGIIADLQGDPLKAENFFKKANALLPNSPELLNNIGFALYSANKLDEAGSYYNEALAIDPGYKKAIYNYALLQARLRKYEQAYSIFAKVSSSAEASNNTGYVAMMNGDFAEANHYLQEAIKSSPQYYKKANDNLKRLEILEKQ
jgi:Flp pilus assembly protein TadD